MRKSQAGERQQQKLGEAIDDATPAREVIHRLFEAPPIRVRERYGTTLYAPYSAKMARRAYLYGHSKYDLWALLESDPEVLALNERAPKITFGIGVGATGHIIPEAVTRKRDEGVKLHFVDQGDPSLMAGLEAWASKLDLKVQFWSTASLRVDPLRLENIKRLLRYTSVRDPFHSKAEVERMAARINSRRSSTIRELISDFEDLDEQIVIGAVAQVILDGRCDSDIDRYPFTYHTELVPRGWPRK